MVAPEALAALGLFVAAYTLFVLFEKYRLVIAAAGSAFLILVGWVPFGHLFPTGWNGLGGDIEWNTLGLLVGLLLFSGLLGSLGFFRWVSLGLLERTGSSPRRLFAVLVILAFVLSAFINSIAVMLVLAAVTLDLARRLGQDPVPLLIAEISASNLGGAATYVGDLPNVILGTYGGLTFFDFLVHTAPAAVASLLVALWLFTRSVPKTGPELPPTPSAEVHRRGMGIALGAFAGMIGVIAFDPLLGIPIWLIGIGGGAVALAVGGAERLRPLLLSLDLETIGFFLCLFILVGGLAETGGLSQIAGRVATAGGGNLLLTGTLLLWSLGLLSTVVDNVPLAAAAGPLIGQVGSDAGLPVAPMIYATALGTDIGGNGSPIGASANIVALAEADRKGVRVTWGTYVRRAFPVMLISLAVANVVWLLFTL